MTPRWFQMRPHPLQRRLYATTARRVWVVAGRGSGKSEVAKRRVVREMFTKQKSANPLFAFVLPTHSQAKRTVWRDFIGLIPPSLVTEVNKTDGYISVSTGATLYIQGADSPERLEGVQWSFVVVDERSDQKPELITQSLLPAMTHFKAPLWQIGVPKRKGIGAKSFKDGWERALHDTTGYSEAYHWTSETVVSPEEVEASRIEMSEKEFKEHYGASWETDTGRVYCSFGDHNMDNGIVYDPSRPIFVGCDFNVTPMSWILAHKIDNCLYCFDELSISDTTTEKTLNYLYMKYGSHPAGWVFVGDAAGRQRKTSATLTDYLHIEQDQRFSPKRLLFEMSNPPVLDRIRNCNAALLNGAGDIRVFFNENCKMIVQDLDSIYYDDDTKEIVVPKGLGHMADALGYLIWHTIAIQMPKKAAGKIIIRT